MEAIDENGGQDLPETFYVRRAQLQRWLASWGFGRNFMNSEISKGVIKKHFIGGMPTAYYIPQEIQRDLNFGNQIPEIKYPRSPYTYYIGRNELFNWLGTWGISENIVRKLIRSGQIPRHQIWRHKYTKFVHQEVNTTLQLGK